MEGRLGRIIDRVSTRFRGPTPERRKELSRALSEGMLDGARGLDGVEDAIIKLAGNKDKDLQTKYLNGFTREVIRKTFIRTHNTTHRDIRNAEEGLKMYLIIGAQSTLPEKIGRGIVAEAEVILHEAHITNISRNE